MTVSLQHESLVGWLASPKAYPHNPSRVEHIETHISHVFLAGEEVYKLKKPVRFDFLEFSTLAAREQACREEVRLNRRLSPDVYLGVVPVTREASGGFRLGGAGETVDWLVHMRRLPTELSLDALHRHGELRMEGIDRLADTLVRFYQSLLPLPMTPSEYCQRCEAHVRGNLRELAAVKHHLPGGVVERVHGFQLQLLLLKPEMFADRVRSGRIVDGHGDLRPEHIVLTEPVAIFDCIEFSADFRRIDVADELAFLAAECDFLTASWVGERIWRIYQERTGDQPPAVLIDFYKSYRACVRAKVAALRALQLDGQEQQSAAAEANRHLAFADQYAATWVRPLVLVVGGLSGTGKTTLAKALADALAAELLRTDLIRRELFGRSAQATEPDEGIYGAASRQRVYDELIRRAAALVSKRVSVVLDGTFSSAEPVQKAQSLVADSRPRLLAIECRCPPEVARKRILQRLTAGRDASDAAPEIHDLQRARWEAWPGDIPQVQVDTTQPLSAQVQRVLTALGAIAG